MPSQVITASTSIVKKAGGGVFAFFSKFISKIKWFFISAIALTIIISSIAQGFEVCKDKECKFSPFPLAYNTIGRVLSADELNYQYVQEIKTQGITLHVDSEDGFWTALTKFWKRTSVFYWILINLFTIYVVYMILYKKVYRKIDDSKLFKAHIRTIVTILFAQMWFAAILFGVNAYKQDPILIERMGDTSELNEYQVAIKVTQEILPLKGTFLLGKTLWVCSL